MKRITIVEGHPDPSRSTLNHALAEHYAQAARAAGHEVRRIVVADMDFPLLRTQEDFEHGAPPPAIARAQQDIAWADHLVLLYPLWLGDMPATLKGFLEQTLRYGFAMSNPGPNGFPKKLLVRKSARIVVTMGMPALVYRWYFGAHSLKSLIRNVLAFSGIQPIRTMLLGGVGTANERTRASWLERAASYGTRGI